MGLRRRSWSGVEKNVKGFYKVLFETQVKRQFYVLLQERWVGGKIG